MEQHVKIVGILNIVAGALGVLIALGILLVFGGVAGLITMDHDPDASLGAVIVGIVGGVVFFVIALISVPSIIVGVGLLKFREWARILGIVVSVLHLFNFPLGTALGGYGIWALTQDETRALLKAKAVGMPAMAR